MRMISKRLKVQTERVEQVAKHCTKADIAYLVPGSTVLYRDPFDNKDYHAQLIAVVRVENAISKKRIGEAMCLIRKSGKIATDMVDVSDITQI